MSSALRLIISSNLIGDAEKMVLAENQRLTADEKKRRLLSFAPMAQDVILGVPTNSAPPGDPTIAALSGDIYQSTSGDGSAEIKGMEFLPSTGHLFIRHAAQNFTQQFFDLANKYEILNSDGLVVLFAGETLEKFGTGKRDRKSIEFDVTILSLDGSALLNIVSRKGVTTISDFKKVIGTCFDVSSIFSPHESYSVRDWNMCELFVLKKSRNTPAGEFDIIGKDLNKVGEFTNNWNASFPNYVGIDKLYGISFPVDMATEEKQILFGALFTLFFQHLQDGGVGGGSRNFLAFGICIFIGVFLVIVVLMLILWGILKD